MSEKRLQETLHELEGCGTAQNRKIYQRHGVAGQQYGVSVTNLRALAKKIKRDHVLARELWASGNHDARCLAMLIADPKQVTAAELDAWARDLDNYVITDALTGFIARTDFTRAKSEQWTPSADEWTGTAGWSLLSHLALNDKTLPDEFFETYLATIEREIHGRKNRVRYAMNCALIAIGGRSEGLRTQALAAAERIGPVEVDHGETNCETPNAAQYIEKIAARQKERSA